jgi:hypothetical protein
MMDFDTIILTPSVRIEHVIERAQSMPPAPAESKAPVMQAGKAAVWPKVAQWLETTVARVAAGANATNGSQGAAGKAAATSTSSSRKRSRRLIDSKQQGKGDSTAGSVSSGKEGGRKEAVVQGAGEGGVIKVCALLPVHQCCHERGAAQGGRDYYKPHMPSSCMPLCFVMQSNLDSPHLDPRTWRSKRLLSPLSPPGASRTHHPLPKKQRKPRPMDSNPAPPSLCAPCAGPDNL